MSSWRYFGVRFEVGGTASFVGQNFRGGGDNAGENLFS